MKAAHLKEAQQIIDSLAWCKKALTMELAPNASASLVLQHPANPADRGYRSPAQEAYNLGAAAREAAFKVWRAGVLATQAERRRRAAQIGLTLED
jgi:hypothetical protein